ETVLEEKKEKRHSSSCARDCSSSFSVTALFDEMRRPFHGNSLGSVNYKMCEVTQ
ncbi:hypothetical protein SK128_006817, partial [Halocaridina rubra]